MLGRAEILWGGEFNIFSTPELDVVRGGQYPRYWVGTVDKVVSGCLPP